jgi:hypothetical protein
VSQSHPSFSSEVDWSRLDELTDNEIHQLFEWYATSHGDGDIQLTPFVPFFAHLRPAGFKRYRFQTVTTRQPDGLPTVAVAFVMMHQYLLVHNELGAYYTTICARNWGASKAEVLDGMEFAFTEAGPLGGNAAAGRAADYLEAWDEDEPRRTGQDPWPRAWRDAEAAPATLDLDPAEPGLSQAELDSIVDSFRGRGLTVPAYVDFLSANDPQLLKILRSRYEHATRGVSLPERIFSVLRLNGAAIAGRPGEAKAMLEAARTEGLTRSESFEAIAWGFLAMPEASIDLVSAEVAPIFAAWDS